MAGQRVNVHKVFVKVRADFLTTGKIVPLLFREEDGPVCKIDKIVDEREAASLKAGGQGIRYLCRVGESMFTLFYDAPQWFIEI